MIDVTLPQMLQSGDSSPTGGLFLFNYRRSTPSPRYRITLKSNLISLLIAGRKSLISPNQNALFDPGTCLLFRKGHCLSADLCPRDGGYQTLLLFFDDDVLAAFKHKYRELLTGARTRARAGVCLPLQGDAFIDQFSQSLRRSLEVPAGLSGRQQLLRFEEILLHLVEREGRTVIDALEAPADDDPDERLRRVVGQHALANLTVEDLAFLCHMSLATFKRRFVRLFGMSPGQWQKAQLLDHAARLLREQQLEPNDVYWRVGYSSPSSFTKSFREYHRVTPKKYQAR